MIVCWSVKGGSGSTVVATALAARMARSRPGDGTVLVAAGDDALAVYAMEISERPGLLQWMTAGPDVPDAALAKLLLDSPVRGLRVLPAGGPTTAPPSAAQTSRLANQLGSSAVVDAGLCRSASDISGRLVAVATTSLLVIRPCYLALRRAAGLEHRPDGVIVIEEASRSLDADDVADVLNVPILARLEWDASVARLVDAGQLATGRTPRSLRPLEALADQWASHHAPTAKGLLRAG